MSDPVDPPSADPTDPPAPTPKTFSQEQVNRMMATEKSEGQKAAINKLTEEFGMPVEEAKAVLKAAAEQKEAQKTELEKLRDEKAAAEAARESEVSKAQQELHSERVKAQLMKAGIVLPEDDEKADAALDRMVSLVGAQSGSTIEEIRTSIKDDLKEQFPQLFTASEAKPSGTPDSKPSGTPTRKPATGETAADRAKRLSDERNKARGVTPTA